jgi:hypothetical protein
MMILGRLQVRPPFVVFANQATGGEAVPAPLLLPDGVCRARLHRIGRHRRLVEQRGQSGRIVPRMEGTHITPGFATIG